MIECIDCRHLIKPSILAYNKFEDYLFKTSLSLGHTFSSHRSSNFPNMTPYSTSVDIIFLSLTVFSIPGFKHFGFSSCPFIPEGHYRSKTYLKKKTKIKISKAT